jgi:hypothetical protein
MKPFSMLGLLLVASFSLEVQAAPRFIAVSGANGGGVVRNGSYTGPNGGSLNTKGVGGFGPNQAFSRRSTQGNTVYGNFSTQTQSHYDRATGKGTRFGSKSLDQNRDGIVDYGVDSQTTYTRGVGFSSTINTLNQGSYVCTTGSGCVQSGF